MAYENLRKEIAKLSEGVPGGYKTFDADGKVVISSDLPALHWFRWAIELLRSPGRQAEKAELRAQLEASTGEDGDHGHLYEVIAAMACGPVGRPASA
jgi:hypothetical protein